MRDAAAVGGTRIRRGELLDEIAALLRNEGFKQLLAGNDFQIGSEGTADARITNVWLGSRIRQAVIDRELAARRLRVSTQHREAAEQSLAASFGGPDVFEAFGEGIRRTLVEREARRQALLEVQDVDTPPPTEAAARRFYRENLDRIAACPSGRQVAHILLGSAAAAEAVLVELRAGAPFAALARQRSTDAGSATRGGDVGCLQDGAFVPEFQEAAAAAELGEPVGPVRTDFGYHVIVVTRYRVPTFEELEEQILQLLRNEAGRQANPDVVLEELIQRRLRSLEVFVDPRFGRWVVDEQGPHLEAPQEPLVRDGRSSTTTTVPSPFGITGG
jgi:hypothetical protein